MLFAGPSSPPAPSPTVVHSSEDRNNRGTLLTSGNRPGCVLRPAEHASTSSPSQNRRGVGRRRPTPRASPGKDASQRHGSVGSSKEMCKVASRWSLHRTRGTGRLESSMLGLRAHAQWNGAQKQDKRPPAAREGGSTPVYSRKTHPLQRHVNLCRRWIMQDSQVAAP